MKRLIPSVVFGLALLLLPGLAWAQQGTVTGTVTEAETGEPLPGANVQITALGAGAATGPDGKFELRVEPGEYDLSVSFVGYQSVTRSVTVQSGSTTQVRIALEVSEAELGEVVVEASGQRQRQARSLGYSISQVQAEGLEETKETNLVQSLSGKVAGVNITSQSGNVGAGSSIQIRGISSLGGDNQPLFVIDGQPISNSNVAAGDRLAGAVTTGNNASVFDPQNIESVSVLKSGAAAALYGQRARNGVILIETKQGSESNAGATFSSSVTATTPSVLPDFQNEYGPGDGGKYDLQDLDGWGPRLDGREVEIFTGEEVSLESRNPVENFWETGIQTENKVSFQNGGEIGDVRLGVTSTNTGGIVPNSELDRYNVNLNAGTSVLEDKLSARVSTEYVKESTLGRAAAGGNDPNVIASTVNSLPRHLSASKLQNNFKESETVQIPLTETSNNPYWTVNKNQFETDVERFFGSVTVSYNPISWLTLQEQIGTDIVSEERRAPTAAGTVNRADGAFFDQTYREREIDHDFTIRTDNSFGDFSLQSILGNNINQRTFEETTNQATNLSIPGVRSYPNAKSNSPDNFFQQQRLVSAYGSATLGFRDYAFLEVTGRNDWSSTLPKDNNSYFYPSVSLSVVFTDLLEQEYDIGIPGVSYGKLRGNFAQVGSDTGPYQLNFTYTPTTSVFTQFVNDFSFPFRGIPAFTKPGVVPPENLQPQQQNTWEVGAELGFLSDRVNVDFTYYNQRTTDQILNVPTPLTTGFGARRTNAGTLVNEGIEATLDVSLVSGDWFTWQFAGNFSRSRTTVDELPGSLEDVTLDAGFNDIEFRVEPGSRPIIFGPGLEKTETGEVIVNPATGLPEEGDSRKLGNLYPDFTAGFSNTFGLGDFTFSFLIDWRKGGKIFSSTVQTLRGSGLAAETAEDREGSFTIDGVIVEERNEDGEVVQTRQNDIPVPSMEEYWGALTSTVGPNVFEATYVKLREASLSYSVPESLVRETPFENASVQLQGRNLLLLFSEVPHIDPETNVFGSGAAVTQGYEFNTVPQTRSIGASLNLSF